MIDLHSHIIPAIDDGAQSWEEAISMCRMAWEDGIQIIAATPHVFNGVYQPDIANIVDQCAQLQNRLRSEKISIQIIPGAEVHSCINLPELLRAQPTLTMNGKGRYFLLEFPHTTLPPNAEQFIFELMLHDYVPIIAHPERNARIQDDASLLEKLVSRGALCQVTAMSLTGNFGKRAKECVYKLLRSGCVHLVASDAHGTVTRPPILSKARQQMLECVGADKTRELFEVFPKKILEGEL